MRAGRAWQAHTGEPPSDEQVGALLGLTRERVMLYRRHVVPAKSLEQPAYAGASHKDRTPVMWDDKVAADDPDVGAEAAHFAADVQVRCPDYFSVKIPLGSGHWTLVGVFYCLGDGDNFKVVGQRR